MDGPLKERMSQVSDLQRRLGLTHWNIVVVPSDPDNYINSNAEPEEYSYVTMRQADRTAEIHVHPMYPAPGSKWWSCVRHEMLHILMTDLEFIASNGRSIELMELYNREQERVINVLAKALGQEAAG